MKLTQKEMPHYLLYLPLKLDHTLKSKLDELGCTLVPIEGLNAQAVLDETTYVKAQRKGFESIERTKYTRNVVVKLLDLIKGHYEPLQEQVYIQLFDIDEQGNPTVEAMTRDMIYRVVRLDRAYYYAFKDLSDETIREMFNKSKTIKEVPICIESGATTLKTGMTYPQKEFDNDLFKTYIKPTEEHFKKASLTGYTGIELTDFYAKNL